MSTISTRGLPIKRPPDHTDEQGRAVFNLRGVDPFVLMEHTRKTMFPGVEPAQESAYDKAVRLTKAGK